MSMELIYYVGSSFSIKLAIFFLLIRQISFMPFFIFKCIIRTKIILESSPKLLVFLWIQRTIRCVKWPCESKANETNPLSFKPSGGPHRPLDKLQASWRSTSISPTCAPLLLPVLPPLFLGLWPGWPLSQLPKCLTLSFPLGICTGLPCPEHFSSIFAWLIPHL